MMTVETPVHESLVRPEPAEERGLAELDHLLKEILSTGSRTAKLISADGEEVEIPASAFHALQLVADGMAHGQTIMLVPQGKELTTQQAADLLHVSRPHLVKLLETEEMPFHYTGTHRRVKIEDVLNYRDRRDTKRRRSLERLTQLSEQLPGGYE